MMMERMWRSCLRRSPEPTNQLRCPACSGTLLLIERMTSAQLYFHLDLSLPTDPSEVR